MRHNHTALAVSALALIAGMTAASGPADAAAQNVLYGGGSTLAAKIYRQIFNCYAKPLFGSTGANTVEGATTPFPPSLPTTECSTTAGDPAPPYKAPFNATSDTYEFLYAPVGSGAGEKAFTTSLASMLGTPATSNAVAFTTTAYSAYPYPAVDFAGSDAALTTTLVADIGPSNGLAAVQIPSFATPIALPFNPGSGFTYPSNFAIPAGGSSKLRLSIADVCGIFTGKIINWNSAILKTENGGVALTAASHPISVYVRADSSGTSQIFSNWLVINCAKTVYPVASGFVASTTPSWPTSFKTASGSGGIADAVETDPYAIAYDSPDYLAPVVPGAPVAANVVDPLNGIDPPTGAAVQLAVEYLTPPSTTGAYAWGQPINTAIATQSTTTSGYHKGAYPITGFTFLDFYECYSATSPHNPLAANDIRYFLVNFLLSGTNPAQAEMRTLLNANGFSPAAGVFLGKERTELATLISYTGKINNVEGSAACNAKGVVGVNG